jgi:hypothetical protein
MNVNQSIDQSINQSIDQSINQRQGEKTGALLKRWASAVMFCVIILHLRANGSLALATEMSMGVPSPPFISPFWTISGSKSVVVWMISEGARL